MTYRAGSRVEASGTDFRDSAGLRQCRQIGPYDLKFATEGAARREPRPPVNEIVAMVSKPEALLGASPAEGPRE